MSHGSSRNVRAAPRSQKPASGVTESRSKFDLIAELGRGGMATVYLARARKGRQAGKLVVLKQLRSELAENAEFLEMFLEEARLAGQLQHPNIVETYEVGVDHGNYYIAMEYLEGLSLQAILTRFGWKRGFGFAQHTRILIEVLRGLEHASTQLDNDGTPLRIVHRDVSPPNIIVTFNGAVKVVDFGIAKAANSHVETRTGVIKGKVTYMAPEQAASGDVDARADTYSVGVMLWQAAARKRRWKDIPNTEVLQRLLRGDVADAPNAMAHGLPSSVDRIVLKAIAPDPDQRFATAADFRKALEGLLREMREKAPASEIADIMSKEFARERTRAAGLIETRLAQLEAADRAEEHEMEGVTSIRSAVQTSPSAAAIRESPSDSAITPSLGSKEAVVPDTRPSTRRVQVGGAAAKLAEKVLRSEAPPPRPKAKTSEATVPSKRTLTRAAGKRVQSLILIGVSAALAIAAIGYAGLRTRRAAASSAAPVAQAPAPLGEAATATQTTATQSQPASPLTASAIDQAAGSIAQPQSAGHRTNVRSGPHAAPIEPDGIPQPVMPIAVDSSPAPQPPPTTKSSGPLPPLDKQDPWGQPKHPKMGNEDPWK